MSSATPETISLSISFRGTVYEVSLPPDAPLTRLEALLEELTSVPPTLQKLLFRGKKVQHGDNLTLTQIGLRDGIKVQMLGSTAQEMNTLNATESEHQRKEKILRERALKPQVKVRCIRVHFQTNARFGLDCRSARPVLPPSLRRPISSTRSSRWVTCQSQKQRSNDYRSFQTIQRFAILCRNTNFLLAC